MTKISARDVANLAPFAKLIGLITAMVKMMFVSLYFSQEKIPQTTIAFSKKRCDYRTNR